MRTEKLEMEKTTSQHGARLLQLCLCLLARQEIEEKSVHRDVQLDTAKAGAQFAEGRHSVQRGSAVRPAFVPRGHGNVHKCAQDLMSCPFRVEDLEKRDARLRTLLGGETSHCERPVPAVLDCACLRGC